MSSPDTPSSPIACSSDSPSHSMYSIPKGTHDHDNDLNLDPGIPTHRKRPSAFKHFCIMILVTIGLIAALFFGRLIVSNFDNIRASLSYKSDLVDPESVIRPLIDEKQTFDIVATVWLRTNDSRSESHDLIWTPDAINGTVSTLPTEKAIFTGTVFKGLKLKDKEIRTTVEYKVPTEIFKNRDLNHYDLRASFVLIPTSPSLLDNLTNYSSWRNEKILFPPLRPWPDTGPAPTLQDKAIDSFGASTGLLSFSGIQSRCAPTTIDTSSTTNASDHSLSEGNAGDEDSDDEIDSHTANETHSNPSKYRGSRFFIKYGESSEEKTVAGITHPESSNGKPVLESHPYIISRSFIVAAVRTKPYDRKAYDQAHRELKTSACGLALSPPNYDWKLCNQKYNKHGDMDTRLQLTMTDEGNKIGKNWAYAPYLTWGESTWTPEDLVPVPVNREDCTKGGRFNDSEPVLPNEEYVNITWEIVYSGRSPTEIKTSQAIVVNFSYDMTDTEGTEHPMQATSEKYQGLRGYRSSEDIHPRRIAFVYALIAMIRFVTTLLNLLYWSTRSSTVGISKFAITLTAAITLGQQLMPFFKDYKSFHTIVMMIATLPLQMTQFLMLKVVWRIEVGWGQDKGKGKRTEKMPKRWGRICLPRINFVKATHRERASDRLDRSISWAMKFALFISCYLAYFFFSPSTAFLIPPLGLSIPQANKFRLRDTLLHSIASPGLLVGSVLQVWFNHRSRTFAGRYKLTVIFQAVTTALKILKFTRVLGNTDVREGFSVDDLMGSIIVVVWCWQAMMLPKVQQGEIDDEQE